MCCVENKKLEEKVNGGRAKVDMKRGWYNKSERERKEEGCR